MTVTSNAAYADTTFRAIRDFLRPSLGQVGTVLAARAADAPPAPPAEAAVSGWLKVATTEALRGTATALAPGVKDVSVGACARKGAGAKSSNRDSETAASPA